MKGFLRDFEVGPRERVANEAREIQCGEIAAGGSAQAVRVLSDRVASFCQPPNGCRRWLVGRRCLAYPARRRGRYAALTPNMRGYEDAVCAKAGEIRCFRRCSEGFQPEEISRQHREAFSRVSPHPRQARATWNSRCGAMFLRGEMPL